MTEIRMKRMLTAEDILAPTEPGVRRVLHEPIALKAPGDTGTMLCVVAVAGDDLYFVTGSRFPSDHFELMKAPVRRVREHWSEVAPDGALVMLAMLGHKAPMDHAARMQLIWLNDYAEGRLAEGKLSPMEKSSCLWEEAGLLYSHERGALPYQPQSPGREEMKIKTTTAATAETKPAKKNAAKAAKVTEPKTVKVTKKSAKDAPEEKPAKSAKAPNTAPVVATVRDSEGHRGRKPNDDSIVVVATEAGLAKKGLFGEAAKLAGEKGKPLSDIIASLEASGIVGRAAEVRATIRLRLRFAIKNGFLAEAA